MSKNSQKLNRVDPIWHQLRVDAETLIKSEPLLGGVVHTGLLHHNSFRNALSYRIATKLASVEMPAQLLREIADEAYKDDGLIRAARADIVAVLERDPACHLLIQPLLFFKGYQALQAYRVAHWLWGQKRREMAYYFQMRCSEVFGVDIHPGATLGQGIMIDHAHSIVIGETARVGDNVSMLHAVTLGGTGKSHARRHPTIEDGVLIGAGAKVLGAITIANVPKSQPVRLF